MKIQVTERGVHGPDGAEIEVGTTMDVKGDTMPDSYVNKAIVVHGKESKTMIVNPADKEADEEKAFQIDYAKSLGIKATKAWDLDKIKAEIEAAEKTAEAEKAAAG